MVTSNRGLSLEMDLDISDVRRGFREIDRLARNAGGSFGRLNAGIGRTVAAGAGLGAGVAVIEQFFERLFELFEGTPVFQQFTMALDAALQAAAPLVGVLLNSLTPVIVALTPAIAPLAQALTPLIELMGVQLLVAVQLITPGIQLFAGALERVTTFIRDVVVSGVQLLVDGLNKLPFVDIDADLTQLTGSFDTISAQIGDTKGDTDTLTMAVGGLGTEGATADPLVKGLADSVRAAGTESDNAAVFMSSYQASLLDARSAAELARIAVAENTTAIGNQTAALNTSSAAVDAYNAFLGKQRQEAAEAATAADVLSLSMFNQASRATTTRESTDTLAMSIGDVGQASETAAQAITDLDRATRAMAEFADRSARAGGPGGLGFDFVSGQQGRKGALDDAELNQIIQNAEPGTIITDPYSGARYLVPPRGASIGRIRIRGGGDLEGWQQHFANLTATMNEAAEAADELDMALGTTGSLTRTMREAAVATDEFDESMEDLIGTVPSLDESLAFVESLGDELETLQTTVADKVLPAITLQEQATADLVNRITGAVEAEERFNTAVAQLPPYLHQLGVEFGIIREQLPDPPMLSAVEQGLADLTDRILAKAEAERVEAEVLKLLSPELRELAESLGILRAEVAGQAMTSVAPADVLRDFTGRSLRDVGRAAADQARRLGFRLTAEQLDDIEFRARESAERLGGRLTGSQQRDLERAARQQVQQIHVEISGDAIAVVNTRNESEGG